MGYIVVYDLTESSSFDDLGVHLAQVPHPQPNLPGTLTCLPMGVSPALVWPLLYVILTPHV